MSEGRERPLKSESREISRSRGRRGFSRGSGDQAIGREKPHRAVEEMGENSRKTYF